MELFKENYNVSNHKLSQWIKRLLMNNKDLETAFELHNQKNIKYNVYTYSDSGNWGEKHKDFLTKLGMYIHAKNMDYEVYEQKDGNTNGEVCIGYSKDINSEKYLEDVFKEFIAFEYSDNPAPKVIVEKKTPTQIIRNAFLNELIEKHNFNEILNKYPNHSEQIKTDIENLPIPYIFALFKHFGYREKLEDFFTPKGKLWKFLKDNLGTNVRDLEGYWRVLNPTSNEDKVKFTSNDFMSSITEKYSE